MFSQIKKKRNNSTTSMATNKGLLNEPGENNCFLNSAIQVLWHLDVFRRSFRQLTGHACMGASCIFCALKDIFQQFQYSKDHALPPNVLRSALAETFQQQNRFQLGLMDDAAECFENILNRIHVHIGNTVHEDVCTAPHCIPHQKFGLTLVQQCVCTCGATSEPFPFIEMVHYVSATALCAENEVSIQRYGAPATSEMFGRLVRVASGWGDIRNCPSGCGAHVEMRKVLMNCPDVVSIGIVWDTDEPEVKHIIDLVHALGTTLRLAHLFHTVVDDRAGGLELYLVGMVCYYGKHYSTFFFHTRLRKWVYFDDAQVSEVGKRWSNVVTKCIKGHHQPLLLLYANPHASQVSVATAPKEVTMLPGYSHFHNRQFINDPLHELAEADSLSGEGEVPSVVDEESSGTESMQLAVTQPPKKTTKAKSPLLSDHRKTQDTSSKKEQKHKKKTKDNVIDKGPTVSENPRQQDKPSPKLTQRHQVVKGSQPVPLDGVQKPQEIRPRKSAFQWNLAADDQSQGNSAKVGHYVEPQPANWTTYQPYNKASKDASKHKKPAFPERGSKENSSRNSLSVKAGDSKGMTTFCVTAKAAPVQRINDYRPDGGIPRERTPSPTPSSRPATQQQPRVLIGRRSPKGWKSSQSSMSSSSSAGKSSQGEVFPSAARHVEVGDAPTTSKSSSNPETQSPRFSSPRDGLLHDVTQSYCSRNDIDLTPIMTPDCPNPSMQPSPKLRPPLPPKPPFLSEPISAPCKPPQEANAVPQSLLSYVAILQAKSVNQPLKLPASTNTSQDRCLSLFRDADDLMEQSRAADTIFDYASALQLCLEATKVIETILTMDGLAEEYLIKARIRHGDYINKSRILQRRRNIRLQSQGSEGGGTRSSMAEADRHMLPPANQILAPTSLVTTSTNHSSSSTSQSNKVANQKSPPSRPLQGKDHRLMEQFEKNESKKNLIDFNKHGVTHLQNDVHRMYEQQHRSKHNPAYRQPARLVRNTNNNSNSKSGDAAVSPATVTSQGDADGSKAERTKIFVWKSPDNDEATSTPAAQKTNHSVSSANISNNDAKPQRKMVSDTDLPKQARKLSKDNNPPDKSSDEEVEEAMKSLEVDPSRRYRSMTPDLQTNSNTHVTHPQQRRSKTPSMRKERPTQTIGHRRGSDLKLRPKSVYEMPHARRAEDNITPSLQSDDKKRNDESSSVATKPNPYSPFTFPHPHPSWGSPSVPGTGSQYYPDFYKWMQFYGMLSPEQRSMLPMPTSNPANANFPPMHTNPSNATLTPAMHKAYLENMKVQLGKNLTNLTESVGRAAPHIRSNNTNIYEASKPKPVGSSNPRLPPNTNFSTKPIQRPIIVGSNFRTSNAPIRRPPVDSRPTSLRPRPNDQTTNQRGSNASRDSQASIQNDKTPDGSTDADKREGMMKWAEEGKKRTPETTMTPEFRKKLLHEFANRPKKDLANYKQSVLQSYPGIKPHESLQSSSTAATFVKDADPTPNAQVRSEPGHVCGLCGLAKVPTPTGYCASCRAYLDRLNPTTNSSRPYTSKPS